MSCFNIPTVEQSVADVALQFARRVAETRGQVSAEDLVSLPAA